MTTNDNGKRKVLGRTRTGIDIDGGGIYLATFTYTNSIYQGRVASHIKTRPVLVIQGCKLQSECVICIPGSTGTGEEDNVQAMEYSQFVFGLSVPLAASLNISIKRKTYFEFLFMQAIPLDLIREKLGRIPIEIWVKYLQNVFSA